MSDGAPGLVIREATPADLAPIVEIYNEAVAEEATADLEPLRVEDRRAWLDAHPRDRHPVLVGEVGGEVVGWVSLSPYRPGRGAVRMTAEISYYVRTTARSRGIARRLIEDAMRRAPGLGLEHLFAIVLDDNLISLRLLERLGFERWGHLPGIARFGDRIVGHVYMGAHLAS